MRSLESGMAPAPCSSAARASTRSSACLSSRVCRAGSEDFSPAMQNYICLNPPEYDIELASQSVADRIRQREGSSECRLHVHAGRAVHCSEIVAHIPVE